MSRLLLVRHGETMLNSSIRFWGDTDVELGDTGIKQAEQVRDRLATERIDTIYSSDMSRASVTAGIIASRHQAAVTICPELHEINFGKVEGFTFEEISKAYPELASTWYDQGINLTFPGGESLADVNDRVIKFIERLHNHDEKETVLVVAHAASLRLLVCRLMGIDTNHWRQLRLDLASLSILHTYPEITLMSLFNDTSHLKDLKGD